MPKNSEVLINLPLGDLYPYLTEVHDGKAYVFPKKDIMACFVHSLFHSEYDDFEGAIEIFSLMYSPRRKERVIDSMMKYLLHLAFYYVGKRESKYQAYAEMVIISVCDKYSELISKELSQQWFSVRFVHFASDFSEV